MGLLSMCFGSGARRVPRRSREEMGLDSDDGTTSDSSKRVDPATINYGFPDTFHQLYAVGEELGRGQFGVTYLYGALSKCTDIATGEEYAAKVIQKKSLTDVQSVDDVQREVDILSALKGQPNVVEFFGAYESDVDVTIVLECCRGGALFAQMIDNGAYSEAAAADTMRQILRVIAACHLSGVIHRDLKPENFLFLRPGAGADLKLIDFGLSEFFAMRREHEFSDVAGSACYVAPEVLRRRYGPSADLWSCGVIMYILLCGKLPFYDNTEAGIFKQVLAANLNFTSGSWANISAPAKQLLQQLLCRDPKARISASKALAHPWICEAGVAPDTPLDIAVIGNMQRYMGYSRAKQRMLMEVARTLKPAELADLRQQFIAMDTDGSGTISIDEMVAAISQFRTGKDNRSVHDETAVQGMMERLDVDGDGTVDYLEFVAASMSTYQMAQGGGRGAKSAWKGRIRLVFDSIDQDGNGFIDPSELLKFMGDTAEVRALIKEADRDGDGRIDYNEFQALLREAQSASARAAA